jgi:hypothetical protein
MPHDTLMKLLNQMMGGIRGNGAWKAVRSAMDPFGCSVIIEETSTGKKYLVRVTEMPEPRTSLG